MTIKEKGLGAQVNVQIKREMRGWKQENIPQAMNQIKLKVKVKKQDFYS